MSQDDNTIVIASAARTPVGSFNGALSTLPAHELGAIAMAVIGGVGHVWGALVGAGCGGGHHRSRLPARHRSRPVGGSRWTSDMAISYFKTVLNIGVQLMVMILLVGIGSTFINNYYGNMTQGTGMGVKEALFMLVCMPAESEDAQAQLDRIEAEGIEVVEPQDIRTFLKSKLAPEAGAG